MASPIVTGAGAVTGACSLAGAGGLTGAGAITGAGASEVVFSLAFTLPIKLLSGTCLELFVGDPKELIFLGDYALWLWL